MLSEWPRRPYRFIPAGAGNTQRIALFAKDQSVYPRWRGEHTSTIHLTGQVSGLSPLARGTLLQGKPEEVRERFIPAGAGNTVY